MKKAKQYIIIVLLLLTPILSHAKKIVKVDFNNETRFEQSKDFISFVGNWHIDKDNTNSVYAVDGRRWTAGSITKGIADKAKAIYGERYAEFLDNLQAYKYFPLTIYRPISNFEDGIIKVEFKTISGRIDQAAGIAFNIKPNGDYLVIRANPLENNLVAFKMEKGIRSVVQWIRNVKTPTNTWHTLMVKINGKEITGYLNGKEYIHFYTKENINGKIGLWSKADSYVFFDNFQVISKKD